MATALGKGVVAVVVLLLFVGGKAWMGTSASGHGRAAGGGAMASAQAAEIEIYTTSFCETCKEAKGYMNAHGIAYTEYDVEGNIDLRREFYARGGKGTPLIFVHGQRMDGFDEREFEQLRGARS